ncbi:MAG: hypothetical protein L0J19_13395, partial [Brevibacterium sp.]|nr:hypothetical protein [Brevibacterium sp.]MDN6189775.1 hypothetical protein [Brevibacterium sp.]
EYFFFGMVSTRILRPIMGQSQRVHHSGFSPMHSPIVWIVPAQAPADLFWRPTMDKPRRDVVTQWRVLLQLQPLWPGPSSLSTIVGINGSIGIKSLVAADLPADRRRCAVQTHSNDPDRVAGCDPAGDFFPIGQCQ